MTELFTYEDSEIKMHYMRDQRPVPSEFRMHTHEAYELYYFAGGSGVFRVEGTPYPLKPGDILLMRPSEAHYIDISDDEPYTRLYINFKPGLFDAIDPAGKLLIPFENREIGTFNRYSAEDFPDGDYRLYIRKIIAPAADRHLQTVTNLAPLLYEIYKAYELLQAPETSHSLDSRIIRYINRHIADDLSAAHLCRQFYISESQLRRIFKKATASTVSDYITTKRLALSRRLMLSGIPPTKVYLSCGFKDYSVFYRAYMKRFGVSPSQRTDK